MKKKIILMIILIFSFNMVLTSCSFARLSYALISMIPPEERDDFDNEWIIGKSYDEVIEKYGEYEFKRSEGNGNFSVYYLKREKYVDALATNPEICYVIYFDSNGCAYAVDDYYINNKGG